MRALFASLLLALLTLSLSGCKLLGDSNASAYALTSAGHILAFNTGKPTDIKGEVIVSGLGTNESLLSLNLANGTYYGITSQNRLVMVNPNTGATSAVGNGFSGGTFGSAAVDYDPIHAILRLFSGNRNLQINLNGSLTSTDTAPFYVPGDPNYLNLPQVQSPNLVAIAYTKSGSPTLFGLDSNTHSLVQIGGAGGSPSPSTGQLRTVGTVSVTFGPNAGFYISNSGLAWVALSSQGAITRLYNIDLNSGQVSLIDQIGNGNPAVSVIALVVNS